MLKRLLALAAVVAIANGAALALAARNAAGARESAVTLTERELRLAGASSDSTGMTLQLRWDRNAPREWLDRRKLTALGFDCSVDPASPEARTHYRPVGVLPRTVYVVLEYDPNRIPGPVVAGDERIDGRTAGARGPSASTPPVPVAVEYAPRLRPVDAGRESEVLRARYPDRRRYIITKGIVTIGLDSASGQRAARIDARVTELLPSQIYVPQALQKKMQAIIGTSASSTVPFESLNRPPRYEVTVEYGGQLLPKAVDVRKIGG